MSQKTVDNTASIEVKILRRGGFVAVIKQIY
jgi:hypothetical protein